MEKTLDYKTAAKIEYESKKRQKKTKYSDTEIKERIDAAADQFNWFNASNDWSIANALTALAMIAYNGMIDERWT